VQQKTEPFIKKHLSDKRPFYTTSWFFILLLGFLVVIVFTPFLFSDKMLYGSDTMGSLDAREFMKTALLQYHQFPMWFSSRLCGMPSIDAMFGDAMYPPTLAALAAFSIPKALGLRLVLHVFLAGLFFFLLLKRGFKMPGFVAFMGAALYMLNPEFFSHVYPGHDGKMFVIAWLPFVIWRMKALMDNANVFNASLLSLGIAICLFTSHIQMSYFMLWGLFLYWVVSVILLWLKDKKPVPIIKLSCFFWVAVAFGVGLSLIQLLPPFMFVRDAFSVRGVDRGFDYAASWSLHWPEAFSLWVPEFGNFLDNYWGDNPFKLNSEYAGAIALLFAVLAIVLKRKPWRIFWGAVAVLALGYALGAHTPVFHIAYAVLPGVKKFRACSMLMFWFSFSTILLASLFFKDVIKDTFTKFTDIQKKKWTRGFLVGIAAITVCAILFSMKSFVAGFMQNLSTGVTDSQKSRIFDANFSKNFVPFLWVWWFFATGCLSMLIGVIHGKVNKYAFLTAVLLIGLVDVLRIDSVFVKTTNPQPYFAKEQVIADIETEMKIQPFRCFVLPGTLPQGGLGIHHLEDVSGFHDNEMKWYREYRGDNQDRNYYTNLLGTMQDGRPYLIPQNLQSGNAFLNMADVRYYLLRQGQELLKIPNNGNLGRISFASKYTVMDTNRIAMALAQGGYDYKNTVALLQEPKEKFIPSTDSIIPPISVIWKSYTPNFRKAVVNVPANGFLRLSEVFYPGWEIRVDNKKVHYYRSDLTWMALPITKGEHVVEMMPKSLYLKKAELVSYPLMAILGIYWLILLGIKMGKRKKVG
jgi:hypothetical protein